MKLKCEIYRDSMQNYKKYAIPRAQLVIADVPYNVGNNFYGSNPMWYTKGDNKNWTDQNIWQFIGEKDIQVCELYQCGYNRLGCLGCPLASKKQREKEMYDFPKYKQAYIRAFDRMIEERKRRGKDVKWSCGEEVYLWWMQDNNVVGQMELSDFIEY